VRHAARSYRWNPDTENLTERKKAAVRVEIVRDVT
jgi:hypothetical protein